MIARAFRRVAQTAGHAADILIIGDVASVGPLAGDADVSVRSIPPGPAAARALRSMFRGVVVVVAPPADDATVLRVARLRQERPGIRAVLADTSPSPDRRLAALHAGFDDAVPLQVDAAEIGARVAIQLLRTRVTTSTRLTVGPGVELDLDARALRRRGRFVHLRPLEFRLLEALCRAPGRPLSRVWLVDQAWGAAPPAGSRTLDVHMRWLREKVERDPDHPVHLLTVRGVGYQLEPDEPARTDYPATPAGGIDR